MGNEQGLQHIVIGHRINGVTKRHMDADQYCSQLIIGQHHAYRYLVHWLAEVLGRLGL